MSRTRYTKIALRAVFGIGIVLAVFALLYTLEQRRTRAEMGAILSAYLSDEVLHNVHDWGSARALKVRLPRIGVA